MGGNACIYCKNQNCNETPWCKIHLGSAIGGNYTCMHTHIIIYTHVFTCILYVCTYTHFRHTRFLNASGTRGLCVGVCTHMYVPVCCPLSKCVSILTCAHTHRFWGQAALHFNYTSLTSCSNLEPGDLDRVTELSWLLICSIRSIVSAPSRTVTDGQKRCSGVPTVHSRETGSDVAWSCGK